MRVKIRSVQTLLGQNRELISKSNNNVASHRRRSPAAGNSSQRYSFSRPRPYPDMRRLIMLHCAFDAPYSLDAYLICECMKY